jgi:predicted MFS family arabinose efflux permease
LNATIALLSSVSFIVVAVMTVTGPLLPLIAEEFGTTVGDAGIIVSAFAVPYGACQILFGPLGDRLGKLRVVAVALAVSTVFVLGCGLARSLDALAAMRFCCGFAMAATIPLAMAWIADEVPYAERQPVIGRFVSGIVLGQIAGGVLGGIAAQYFDWRHIFFVFAGCCMLFSTMLWSRRGAAAGATAVPQHSLREILRLYAGLFREPHTRAMIVAGTLEGLLVFGVLAYFGAYLRHRHALDYDVIGMLLAVYGLGGVIYTRAVHRLVPLLGERRMIVGGTVLLGAGYLALVVVPAWWLTAPVFLCAGFGFYLFHNTMQTRATELSAEARGTAVALWVFMLFVGQGVGVVLVGAVIDRFGYSVAFTVAGIGVAVLGLWFQGRLGPPAVARAR